MRHRGRWFQVFGIALVIVVLTFSYAYSETNGSLFNAFQSLYYYSARIDDRFPTINPVATAVDELKKQISSNNLVEEARTILGLLYFTIGDLDDAEEEFKQASRLLPDNPSLHILLGDVYFEQGRLGLAQGAYQRAVTAEHFARAHYGLGKVYFAKEQYRLAADEFSHAVELAEDFVLARLGWGKALYYQGEAEQAAEQLELVLTQNSRMIDAHHYLSLLYEDMGEASKAEHARERATELRSRQ